MRLVTPSIADAHIIAAFGYFRIGEGTRNNLPDTHRATISAYAAGRKFLVTAYFSDTTPGDAEHRPGYRALVDAVRELGIRYVVIPSTWHLSLEKADVVSAGRTLRLLDCTVLATRFNHR